MTKKQQVKISKEVAKADVIAFLESHHIDCDFEDMEEDESETMQALIEQLARPIKKGRAVIDGKSYTLTLLEPQGELVSASFEKMTFRALTHSDQAKAGQTTAGHGRTVAAMWGITYAELCKMPIQDFNILNALQRVFMSA